MGKYFDPFDVCTPRCVCVHIIVCGVCIIVCNHHMCDILIRAHAVLIYTVHCTATYAALHTMICIHTCVNYQARYHTYPVKLIHVHVHVLHLHMQIRGQDISWKHLNIYMTQKHP